MLTKTEKNKILKNMLKDVRKLILNERSEMYYEIFCNISYRCEDESKLLGTCFLINALPFSMTQNNERVKVMGAGKTNSF